METKEINFNIELFQTKALMSESEYYSKLKKESVDSKLLKPKELKHFLNQFKHLKLSTQTSSQSLENIVKLRLRDRLTKLREKEINAESNKDTDLMTNIIKHKESKNHGD